jgi:hypothetical protein
MVCEVVLTVIAVHFIASSNSPTPSIPDYRAILYFKINFNH